MLITVLLHLLVTLSFSFSPTYCTPHTSITAIQEKPMPFSQIRQVRSTSTCGRIILLLFKLGNTSITAIQKQLNFLGCTAISSQNNFKSSFKCEACQATFKFQNSFQAVWLLTRHTGEKTHQIKAGWMLD